MRKGEGMGQEGERLEGWKAGMGMVRLERKAGEENG